MSSNVFHLHAREIRERLKGRVDPELLMILCALAEDNSKFKQQLIAMAQDLDKMTSIITDFVQVATNMKTTVEKIKSLEPQDSDDDTPIM